MLTIKLNFLKRLIKAESTKIQLKVYILNKFGLCIIIRNKIFQLLIYL